MSEKTQKDVYEEVKKGEDGISLRQSKKARLAALIGLIIVAAAIAFFFEKTRLWMFGIIALLLVGVGLEVNNTDYDLGKMMETKSLSESKVLRDKEGNMVTDSGLGKAANEYNCDDFSTQPEAQRFFERVGGPSKDVNRLDGNNDGIACQSLPTGAQ
jgi:F0F1-type ATP synthase assembly protein I